MKISVVLMVLICINTSVLLSEPIAFLLKDISSLWFIFIESFLVFGYSVHSLLKDKAVLTDAELNQLKTILTKRKTSA